MGILFFWSMIWYDHMCWFELISQVSDVAHEPLVLINTNISFIVFPPTKWNVRGDTYTCLVIGWYAFFSFVFAFVNISYWLKFLSSFFQGPGNSFAKEFLGFAIYVSNTTKKEDGVLCFKDTNSTINDITPVFNITCPVHGQYVIYYNERKGPKETMRSMSEYAFNDLCEVEVYGNSLIICRVFLPLFLLSISMQMVDSEYRPLCS